MEEENIAGVKAVGQQGRKDQEVHVGGLKGPQWLLCEPGGWTGKAPAPQ